MTAGEWYAGIFRFSQNTRERLVSIIVFAPPNEVEFAYYIFGSFQLGERAIIINIDRKVTLIIQKKKEKKSRKRQREK